MLLKATALKYIYHESLYTISDKKTIVADVAIPQELVQNMPEYVGGNKKNILIIHGYQIPNTINEHRLNFLTKILQAVRLSIDDVTIMTWDDSLVLAELNKKFDFKVLIGIDILPDKLGLDIEKEKYNIYDKDAIKYLWTDSLENIESDIEKKKLLWKNLKTLFN